MGITVHIQQDNAELTKQAKEIKANFFSEEKQGYLLKFMSEFMKEEYESYTLFAEETIVKEVVKRVNDIYQKLIDGHTDLGKALFNPESGNPQYLNFIKGDLFEHAAQRSLRKIVEAHADLIHDTYIEDLHKKIKKLDHQIHQLNYYFHK